MTMVRRGSTSRRHECASSTLTPARVRSRSAERAIIEIERCPASSVTIGIGSFNVPPHFPRSMSDPFDDATAEECDVAPREEVPTTPSLSRSSSFSGYMATLPRFPVLESRNLNCWSETPIDGFRVRGVNYLKDKKKIKSGQFLFESRGVDLLLTDDMPKNVGRYAILGGNLRALPTFIINFRFPWGLLILYFEIPDKYTPYLHAKYSRNESAPPMIPSNYTPAETALVRFLLGDDDHRNARLKLIPYVVEGPWIARNAVAGKPTIIGKRLPVTYHYEPADPKRGFAEYLEADLDIGSSSAAAKKIVNICKRYMENLTFDIGFVVQGDAKDELPEQMLGSVRVHGLDPLKAPALSA